MTLQYDDPKSVSIDASKLEIIETLTKQAIKDNITAGLNMLVARHGKIIYHKVFGNLTLAEDSPPAPIDAVYSIMSITKPVAAALIMMLQERKLLSINDPVKKYFPEFTGGGKEKVKLHHLLTHTSGMTSGDMNDPLTLPTGKEMAYSSTGYYMLLLIVEKVTRKSLHMFAKENLFKPLGMKDTSFKKTRRQIEGRVIQRRTPEGEKDHWMNMSRCYSGGRNASSTAYDLAVFGQMFLNKGTYNGVRVLSEKSVELMTTNQIPGVPAKYGAESFDEAAWGYGFNISGVQTGYPTQKAYSHSGYCGSYLLIDPVVDIVMVIFKALHKDDVQFSCLYDAVIDACTDI
jgi:CubicO group peptidase (beta-lactamase class C family)